MIVLDRDPVIHEDNLLGIGDDFPDEVWILEHTSTGRVGCYCHQGIHGVACFSSENGAIRFSEHIALSGMSTRSLTFDEARDIAKSKSQNTPVVALLLLDDLNNPQIHYVK